MAGTLHFIIGPSAVGKTALSLPWAEANNAEILSCDSLLVYRGMDIGTAKPSVGERQRVIHHGIDQVSINAHYSINEYQQMAQRVITDIHQRGINALIVGGSGFYLKSFFAPVVDRLNIPPPLKRHVNDLHRVKGLEGVTKALLDCNPKGTGGLDLENPRRVINALERCLASGKTVAQLSSEFEELHPPFESFDKKVCIINRDRDDLFQRVRLRVKKMIEEGLVSEVSHLLTQGIEKNPSASSAIGYRETINYLKDNGEITKLEAAITENTQRLIKKQLTWFQKQIPINCELHLQRDEIGNPDDLFK